MSANRRYLLYVLAPTLTTSVLLCVMGGLAAWYVQRLSRDNARLLHTNIAGARTSEQLVIAVRDVRLQLLEFLATGDISQLQQAAQRRVETSGLIRRIADLDLDSKVRAQLRALLAEHKRVFDQLDLLGQTPPAADPEDTARRIRSLIHELGGVVLERAQRLHALNQAAVAAHNDRNVILAGNIAWGLLALGVCGGAGCLLGGFGIARQVVRRVEQSERESTRAEQLAGVGQLASGLAHELRNPLMTMEVLVQTATEMGGEGRLEGRDLEVLENEIGRLKNLVQSFLDFARPPRPDSTPFDFRQILRQTVQLVSSTAHRQDVEIIQPTTNQPLVIDADPVQIRQVVLNLLLNAIDAQPLGGRIRLHAEVESNGAAPRRGARQSTVMLVFQVTDHGPGISEHIRARMFDPFISSKETGMGLGLSICKRIVEAHQGEISATNVADGAMFTVRLPARRPQMDDPTLTRDNAAGVLEPE